jgi:hypothetical protein
MPTKSEQFASNLLVALAVLFAVFVVKWVL